MTNITEASATAGTPIGAVLQEGIGVVSLQQELTFTKYVRLVLPADGFVFLVRADLVSPGALALAAGDDQFAANAPVQFVQKGSLHYATDTAQNETETVSMNHIVFTSEAEVTLLNIKTPSIYYLGEINGTRFAFSSRKSFYRQADLWHYVGATRWSDLASQIIDTAEELAALNQRVVSNSLPIWLGLQSYSPPVSLAINPGIALYPSYLVPLNLEPPFGVVHIEPSGTIGIAAAPSFDAFSTQTQLCIDKVTVTFFGVANDAAMDFIAWVDQFTLFNPGVMGLMNIPIPKDEKLPQLELRAIAMKKTIEFAVNYYQVRANDIARQLIKTAPVTVIPQ